MRGRDRNVRQVKNRRLVSDLGLLYRGTQLLAIETSSGRKHFHLDHLGTPRLITNASGQKVAYHLYYPSVKVRLTARDLKGNVVFDKVGVYAFRTENDLIRRLIFGQSRPNQAFPSGRPVEHHVRA